MSSFFLRLISPSLYIEKNAPTVFNKQLLDGAAKLVHRLADEGRRVHEVGVHLVGQGVAGPDAQPSLGALRHLTQHNTEVGDGVLRKNKMFQALYNKSLRIIRLKPVF